MKTINNITLESLPGVLRAISETFIRKGDVSAISINSNPAAEIYFKDDGTLDYYVTPDGETHETPEDLKSYIAEKIAEAQLSGEGGNVDLSIYAKKNEVNAALDGKVNKEEGKALSSNDFTNELKEKLENLDLTNIDPDNVVIYTGNDAARALLGGTWRIPSKTDWEELVSNATRQSATINGFNGTKWISKTDSTKYIFIPNTSYWSSTIISNNNDYSYYYYYLNRICSNTAYKYQGFTIRPVSDDEGVDLGLPSGLRWASCNLGATSEEQNGNYYAWGETETKTSFTKANYKYTRYSGGSSNNPNYLDSSNYPTSINLGERLEGKIILGDSLEIVGFQKKDGTVISLNLPKRELKDVAYTGNYDDLYGKPSIPSYYETLGKTKNEFTNILTGQPGDDAARVVLGGLWKIPSCDDWAELYNNTTREETTIGSVSGFKYKSKTNNSYIFIPGNSGYYDGSSKNGISSSYFWTSETWNGYDSDSLLVSGKSYGWGSMSAHFVDLTTNSSSLGSIYSPSMSRYYGLTIRPVTQEAGKGVDLGLPSGLRWASCNLGATSEEQNGNYYAWGETETKTSYTQNNYKYYIDNSSEANNHRPWYSKYNTLDGYRFLQLEEAVPARMYYNMQGKLVKMIDLYGKEYNVSNTSDNPGTGEGGSEGGNDDSFLSNDEINDLVDNSFN